MEVHYEFYGLDIVIATSSGVLVFSISGHVNQKRVGGDPMILLDNAILIACP